MRVLSEKRRELLEVIKREGPVTVDALVERLGASKTAVRAHLLTLEQQGFVERAELKLDRPGRPPLAFQVAAGAEAVFPTNEPALFRGLLEFLEAQGHGDLVEAFFEQVWDARQAELERRLAGAGPGRSLEVLEGLLEEDHFMPEIEQRDGADGGPRRVVVRECNCPLPAAVGATRLPCKLEVRFLAKAIGGRPVRARIAPEQPGQCEFEFEVSEDAER